MTPTPGSQKWTIWIPKTTTPSAATICPASFTGGGRGRRSSSAPITTITPTPTSRANGSEVAANSGAKVGSNQARPSAARTPTAIASPPMVGTTRSCDTCGPVSGGRSSAPSRRDNTATSGASAAVTTAASAATSEVGDQLSRPGPARRDRLRGTPGTARPGRRPRASPRPARHHRRSAHDRSVRPPR
jgi:hypothetical protein